MEGATSVKAEKGWRTGNIPETSKCEVQRGMGGCAEKGGWRGKKGSEHEGPHKVFEWVLTLS